VVSPWFRASFNDHPILMRTGRWRQPHAVFSQAGQATPSASRNQRPMFPTHVQSLLASACSCDVQDQGCFDSALGGTRCTFYSRLLHRELYLSSFPRSRRGRGWGCTGSIVVIVEFVLVWGLFLNKNWKIAETDRRTPGKLAQLHPHVRTSSVKLSVLQN
jgi:hypothetical protein